MCFSKAGDKCADFGDALNTFCAKSLQLNRQQGGNIQKYRKLRVFLNWVCQLCWHFGNE